MIDAGMYNARDSIIIAISIFLDYAKIFAKKGDNSWRLYCFISVIKWNCTETIDY